MGYDHHLSTLTMLHKYFSVDIGSKKMVDISVMRCPECRRYYTPFTNLLNLTKLHCKGQEVFASKANSSNSIAKVEVRLPYLMDISEYSHQLEKAKAEEGEQRKQYFDDLREVYSDCIVLSNKPSFIAEHKCPNCQDIPQKEYVKISQRGKFILFNIRSCKTCGFDYITPTQLYGIDDKARRKVRGHYSTPPAAKK